MSIETKNKKKILYPYIIFGIILFVILYIINFMYSKYIIGLTIGHNYNVSGIQYHSYKYKTYEELFDDVFTYDIKTLHRIKNVNVDVEGLTVQKPKSTFYMTLILTDYITEEELENKINKRYFDQVNQVIENLEDTSNLWEVSFIENSYKNLKVKKLNEAYNSFIDSEFFKKYPAINCNQSIEYCLKIYADFYLFVFNNLSIGDEDEIKKLLNVNGNKNISIYEIYKDLNSYKKLYSSLNPDLIINKENYFSEIFYKLLASNTYSDYILEQYCSTYSYKCQKKISDSFNRLLFKHKQESKHLYEVKYMKPKEKQKFHFVIEGIKILGFTILITYILFILTNKFLARRLK